MDKKKTISFFAVVVLFNMAANFAHPVTPTVIKELQLNDYMFGVALGAMMICNFLFSPFWGKLNNYIPSKMTMLICASGYGIGQILFGVATSEWMIIVARMFAGTFIGGAFVSFLTYTVNVSTPENRGRDLMINATIQSVAGAFGYFVGGILGEISVFGTFFIQAVTLVISGILFYWILDDDRKERNPIVLRNIAKEANPFVAFKTCAAFMSITFLCLFGVSALANLGTTAFDQCFNYYLKDQFALTSAYNGIIKAGIGLLSLVANSTICMYLIKKTNTTKSSIAVLMVCATSMFFVLLSNQLVPFIIVNIIFFAFNAISIPLIQDMVTKGARKEDSNMVMGFYNATRSLGGIVGAFAAGGIYVYNPKYPFLLGFIAFVVSVLLGCVYFYRSKKVRMQ